MKNRWNSKEAKKYEKHPLKMRVYTSRLLGQDPDLVLHGGGNTSVKATVKNLFGEKEEILYVKGSGWDLATIEEPGFAPVKMDVLLKMAQLKKLSDSDMVKFQRAAMTDPGAPNPSVEAILHAIIPFKFVDHTHTDAVVTITNTPDGEKHIQKLYGKRVLVVPYVMPGFILAQEIYKMTKGFDWSTIEGMVLLNHGLFTFSDDAKESYDKMIQLVSEAEKYLEKRKAVVKTDKKKGVVDHVSLAAVRKKVAEVWGRPVLASVNNNADATSFSDEKDVARFANRGPVTPDHIIRTKRVPAMIGNDPVKSIDKFVKEYEQYFKRHNAGSLTMLDPAPRWAVWPSTGVLAFGKTPKDMNIILDICDHTMKCQRQAEKMGGWKALPQKDLFEMEYWELEQAKLKKGGASPEMQGKVALVTGAASGIGKACVEDLVSRGAVVIALDINKKITSLFDTPNVLGVVCDVTDTKGVKKAIETGVERFGGLDLLVSNAGFFPSSTPIKTMDAKVWSKSMDINLTSHEQLMQLCLPYLELGIGPAIVIVASKNVPAPGPGAAAYSVAKAGLTQLARVAALELGGKGIRVNVVHPNAVYDTAIWTDEVLKQRAKHYGLSVKEYKTNNVLNTEVTSKDVAVLVSNMLGDVFAKTTGAQVPIDGGNERII